MSQIFNIVEELEKERKKNKELEEKYNSILSDCVRLREQKIKYKSRIDKIKEYIKEHQRKDEFLTLNEWQTRELLELLEEINE